MDSSTFSSLIDILISSTSGAGGNLLIPPATYDGPDDVDDAITAVSIGVVRGDCVICLDADVSTGGIRCEECSKFMCRECAIAAYEYSKSILPTCAACPASVRLHEFYNLGKRLVWFLIGQLDLESRTLRLIERERFYKIQLFFHDMLKYLAL